MTAGELVPMARDIYIYIYIYIYIQGGVKRQTEKIHVGGF